MPKGAGRKGAKNVLTQPVFGVFNKYGSLVTTVGDQLTLIFHDKSNGHRIRFRECPVLTIIILGSKRWFRHHFLNPAFLTGVLQFFIYFQNI